MPAVAGCDKGNIRDVRDMPGDGEIFAAPRLQKRCHLPERPGNISATNRDLALLQTSILRNPQRESVAGVSKDGRRLGAFCHASRAPPRAPPPQGVGGSGGGLLI